MATRGRAAKEEVKDEVPEKKKGAAKFESRHNPNHIITMLVDYNPKRKGSSSADRFDAYEDEMTVAEALKGGVTSGDLNWDVKHGFIEIGEEFNKKAEVKSKPEPKPKAEKKDKDTPKRGKAAKEEEEEEEEEEAPPPKRGRGRK